jgi:hypothetical protein
MMMSPPPKKGAYQRKTLIAIANRNEGRIPHPSHFIGVAAFCFAPRSPLFELALVLMRLDHVASVIVNTDDGLIRHRLLWGAKLSQHPSDSFVKTFKRTCEHFCLKRYLKWPVTPRHFL